MKTHNLINLTSYLFPGGSIQNRQIGRPPTVGRAYSQVNSLRTGGGGGGGRGGVELSERRFPPPISRKMTIIGKYAMRSVFLCRNITFLHL